MKTKTTLSLLFIAFTLSNCNIENRLCGTWRSGFSSLKLCKDKSFSLTSFGSDTSNLSQVNRDYKMKATSNDGKWYILNKRLYLNFNDSLNSHFGGCKSAQIMRSIFFPTRLYRERWCGKGYPAKPVIYVKDKQLFKD